MFKMGINKKNGLKPCFFKIKTLFRKIEKKLQILTDKEKKDLEKLFGKI